MDFKRLLALLLDDGWHELPGRKHRKFVKDGVGMLVVPTTPSDHRTALNARAEVRRLYRRAGLEPVV